MKILNITKQYEENTYGGVETLIDVISNELYKKGYKSDVYTIKKKKTKKKGLRCIF